MPGHDGPWDLAAFLNWERNEPERYEFVGGRPRLMTGGSQAHSIIIANLVRALGNALVGNPCRPSGDNLRVPITATNRSRYPDIVVDCGKLDPTSHDATEPTIVAEVLSPSNTFSDMSLRLRDYDSIPSIRCYFVVDQEQPFVMVYERDAAGRLAAGASHTELHDILVLEPIKLDISLGVIYDRLEFQSENTRKE